MIRVFCFFKYAIFRLICALSLALLFFPLYSNSQIVTPKGAKLIAASVALVEDRVVTLRETQISAELQKHLAQVKTSDWAVELDPVSQTVLNIIAAKEAKSFQIAEVDESEIIEGLKKIKNSEAVRASMLKEAQLRKLVSEKILAEKFLVLRSEGLRTVVTEQEIRDYFEKNKLIYKNMPFEKFKETVRRDLEVENRQKRFLEWFEVLKQKYKVRIYGQPRSATENN